jgi:N-acetylglucosaminyldiphosphoundecaprenol N-acetyl-beta-D-mannosaminyltransferase
MPQTKSMRLLGVPVQPHTMTSLMAYMEDAMVSPRCATLCAVSAHSLSLSFRCPEYLNALRRADVIYADGASIILGSSMLGKRLPAKLWTGDVWKAACPLAQQRGYRFFLLGGEKGLAEEAKLRTLREHPKLQVVGTHHGYFDFADERIVKIINASRPDLLWVGMGDPAQTLWLDAFKEKLEVGVAITCGGLFKLIAKRIRSAPPHWHKAGFGWLYRILQEPNLWKRYAVDLPTLTVRILAQRLAGYGEER